MAVIKNEEEYSEVLLNYVIITCTFFMGYFHSYTTKLMKKV